VVQPTVTEDCEKAPSLKFGHPGVMALFLALTLFQHLIDGFHNRDLRAMVADRLTVTTEQYTPGQMTYDLRRLRLKGLIFQPPRTNRYFVTPYGWKVARLFSRLEARVSRPAMAMFTANDAVLLFPLRHALWIAWMPNCWSTALFRSRKPAEILTLLERSHLHQTAREFKACSHSLALASSTAKPPTPRSRSSRLRKKGIRRPKSGKIAGQSNVESTTCRC
jgi:hypothetical protein